MNQNDDSVDRCLRACIYPREHDSISRPQLEHRLHLTKSVWGIGKGDQILEIGCGQGDCTIAIADALYGGAHGLGHVDAIDPCPPDYGSPFTVGAAQKHLLDSSHGHLITFIQADPLKYLQSNKKQYDSVILNNCLWYFQSKELISELFRILVAGAHVKKIYIAEWSLEAPSTQQMPHLLAALIRANLEYLHPNSTENIRNAVSPRWIRDWFRGYGKDLEEQIVECTDGLLDGKWEVGSILKDSFRARMDSVVTDGGQKFGLEVMRDALTSAVGQLPGGLEDVLCMPIWVATITL